MQLPRRLRTAALRGGLFASLLATLGATARAQTQADSVPLTFGVWAPRSTSGASAGTIDSAGASPRTFSDLLTARMAGVSVSRTSGVSGAAARVLLRARNSVTGTNEPMLVVDGVVMAGSVVANQPIVSGA